MRQQIPLLGVKSLSRFIEGLTGSSQLFHDQKATERGLFNVILSDGETVVGVSNDIEEDDDQSSLVSWKALLWLY